MEIKELVQGLHPLERKVVPYLDKVKSLKELVQKTGLQEVEAMRALQWLENKKVLKIEPVEKKTLLLDVNGLEYAKKKLPEKRFLLAIKSGSKSREEILKFVNSEEFGICIGLLKQRIAMKIEDGKFIITPDGKKILEKESLEEALIEKVKKESINVKDLKPEEQLALQNLAKRKNILKLKVEKIKNVQLTELGKKLGKQKLPDST